MVWRGFYVACRSNLQLLVILLGGLPLMAQEMPVKVFAEANDFFQQANQLQTNDPQQAHMLYRRAALRYKSLLDEANIRNPKLYYNLANTYHQMDEIGLAILNYRRALRVDPGDRNALRNLDFARTKRQDKLEQTTSSHVLETLFFWHFDFSTATRVQVFGAAWSLFWISLIFRQRGKEWVPKELTIVMGVVSALFLGSIVYEVAIERQRLEGVVTSQNAIARQGDGQSYEVAFQDPLHAGVEFRVLETRRNWYQIELPDGRRCWIPSVDVELIL